MKNSQSGNMKIYLHVAIPTSKENIVLPDSLPRKCKRAVRTVMDWAVWALGRRFQFKGYNYTRRAYCNRGDIAIKLAIKELLQKSLHGVELEFIESEWGCLSEAQLQEVNRNAALFVVAGGGYWVFSKQRKLSPSFLADLPYFEKMSCPLVVFGSGVNFNMPTADAKFDFAVDASLREAFLRFDQRIDLLALRSTLSYDFLCSLGMRKPRLLCDPAVFLEPRNVQPRAVGGALKIGINLAFHGPFAEQIFQDNILLYIDFLKAIQQKFQPDFYYYVHSDEEFLIVQLLRFAGIKLEVIDQPAAELTGAYAKLDVLLCQMMHSNILSFNAGVPALNIAYDSKNFGFNMLIGMEEYCVSAHGLSAQVLTEKMTRLIAERELLALRLHARKKELSTAMDTFLHEIRTLALRERLAEDSVREIKISA